MVPIGHLRLSSVRRGACSCTGVDCATMTGTMIEVRDLFHLATGRLCRGERFVSFNRAQFVVSRRRILRHPPEFYKMLLSAFHVTADDALLHNHHFLSPEKISRWRTADGQLKGNVWSNNPLFGHSMERAWSLIFNCSSPLMSCNPCVCVD